MSRHGHRDHGHRHRRRATIARCDAANAGDLEPAARGRVGQGARGVIINVTGGPDLSLIEVSEASAIIQEAAHEDANIIFGAVVDPKMEGKVKITVIATGFDRVAATPPATASSAVTPVDLQLVHRLPGDREDRGLGGGGGGSRLSVSRRPVLEMPAAMAVRRLGRRPSRPGHGNAQPRRRIRAGVAAGRAGVPAAGSEGNGRPRHRSAAAWRPGATRGRLDRSTGRASAVCFSSCLADWSAPDSISARSARPRAGRAGPRARRSLPRESATSANRTAAGCASRSRSRTRTSSGCPTSASRRSTGSSTSWTSVVCERVFLPGPPGARRRSWRRARRFAPSSRRRRSATSTSSRSPSPSSGTTPTSSRCCGWPACRSRAEARTRHDPLVVIGGAVTFVNPEPLAPFADVIAAGEGEVLIPALMRAIGDASDRAATSYAGSPPSAASTSRRSTTSATTADGTIAAFEPKPGTGAPAGREEGGGEEHRSARSAGDDRSSRPTPSSARGS